MWGSGLWVWIIIDHIKNQLHNTNQKYFFNLKYLKLKHFFKGGLMALNLGDLQIRSPAFGSLERIPERYVYDGDNISPPVEWSGAPPDTKEFALICHDPDAPLPYGFTHWVVYGIPADVTGIGEGKGKEAFTEGTTGYGEQDYGGPAPPPGHGPHHYYFWLYALDKALNLKPGLTREQLLDAIADHIIVQARVVGIYEL